jgi:hypothetical protein
MRTLTGRGRSLILHATAIRDILKEVNQLPNPLAIGVTIGGLLLDVIAPRPKPRAGFAHEFSLLSEPAVSRTPRGATTIEEYDGTPVASGTPM